MEICRFSAVCDDAYEWSAKALREVGLCDEKGVPNSQVRAGVLPVDVAAGQHAAVLHRLVTCTQEGRRIWLAHGVYNLGTEKRLQLFL